MENLKFARKAKGLTQEDLGKLVNVQKAAISKYEKGYIQPSHEILIKLSQTLDVSIDYLIGNVAHEAFNYVLNAHEKKVILAYRNKLSMQPAVDRLLGIEDEHTENPGVSYIAADGQNLGGGTTRFSKEELAALHTAPETDENF